MPIKSWLVQVHLVGGKPKTPMVFTDLDKLCAFIHEFRKAGSSGALTVYSMKSATDKEERQTRVSGISNKSE
jgi:hypothetical protein